MQTQRQNYRKGKLSAERVRCLEELGFKWDQRHVLGSRKARDLVDQQKWDKQFTQLTMGSMGTILFVGERFHVTASNSWKSLDSVGEEYLLW